MKLGHFQSLYQEGKAPVFHYALFLSQLLLKDSVLPVSGFSDKQRPKLVGLCGQHILLVDDVVTLLVLLTMRKHDPG